MSLVNSEAQPVDTENRIVAYMAPGQNIKDDSWKDGIELLEEPGTEAIYAKVMEATGVNVVEVCGRDEPVTDPGEIQPATYAIGYAHSEALKSRGVTPDLLICFSACEILMSAINRSVTLEEGAAIARRRGVLQSQIAGGTGGGVAVIYKRPLHLRKVKNAIRGIEGVHFAGKITPMMSTFGYRHGSREELESSLSNVEGVRRIIDIPNLNFGLHGPDMEKVREGLAEFLAARKIKFKDGLVPQLATRTARLNTKGQTIMHNFIWQTDNPIKFEDAMMKSIRLGINDYYDLGPGDTMADLMRNFPLGEDVRINPVKVLARQLEKEKTA